MKPFVFILMMCLLGSCEKYFQPREQPKPVARVGESYLYEKDIENLGTTDLSEEDSTTLVDSYIDNWVQKQALLQNASRNLTPEQLVEVDQKVLEYKESLLSYLYETRIIEQRLDTVVSEAEIQNYYEEHQDDFQIKTPIIKFIAIKRDKEFQNILEINDWILQFEKSGNDAELRDYCSFQSIRCFLDVETWVSLDQFYETLDAKSSIDKVVLRKNRLFKLDGENYFYLYKIYDLRTYGTYPIHFVRNQIKTLIKREREQAFLEDLRSKILENAKNNNEIEIYD